MNEKPVDPAGRPLFIHGLLTIMGDWQIQQINLVETENGSNG